MFTYFFSYFFDAFTSEEQSDITIIVDSSLTTEEIDVIINAKIEANRPDDHEVFQYADMTPPTTTSVGVNINELYKYKQKLEKRYTESLAKIGCYKFRELAVKINEINCEYWADFEAYVE